MRSHRYRNPRVALPRVDRNRPGVGGMLPPTQADSDRMAQILARYETEPAVLDATAPADEVPTDV